MSEFTILHISIPAIDDCINITSAREICVRCNCCGRFNEKTKYKSQLKMYKNELISVKSHEKQLKSNLNDVKEKKKYLLDKIEQIKRR
jgi:hypothetical protein